MAYQWRNGGISYGNENVWHVIYMSAGMANEIIIWLSMLAAAGASMAALRKTAENASYSQQAAGSYRLQLCKWLFSCAAVAGKCGYRQEHAPGRATPPQPAATFRSLRGRGCAARAAACSDLHGVTTMVPRNSHERLNSRQLNGIHAISATRVHALHAAPCNACYMNSCGLLVPHNLQKDTCFFIYGGLVQDRLGTLIFTTAAQRVCRLFATYAPFTWRCARSAHTPGERRYFTALHFVLRLPILPFAVRTRCYLDFTAVSLFNVYIRYA